MSYSSTGSSTISADTRRKKVDLSSNSNTTGTFLIEGIIPSADVYTITGSMNVSAQTQQVEGERISFNGTTNFTDISYAISKSTKEITSGTAAVTMSGTGNNVSYSFEAQVVFDGGDTATIIINGEEYTLNIPTGELRS